MTRPSTPVLVCCGVATALLVAAVTVRVFVKPCPCAEQYDEAPASAEAVAMASAIVERGRAAVADILPTFDTPKVAVPADVAPGGQPPADPGIAGLAGAMAARIAAPVEPLPAFGPVVLPGAPPAPSNGAKKRAPK